ncbi:MAG: Calx-beta domain-containing protein [Gammaproteobacteria bacterium]|nr:Calx-beta domain-containing protein [Gammaproteobacteria bacterium]
MISTANNYKNKALSIFSAILLGTASILGLQSCNSGGGDSTLTTVNVSGGSVVEGDAGTQSITFTATLSAAAGSSTTVDYATSDGTAVAGTDYTAKSGTLAFTSGSTTATITVDVAGDTAFEFDETITLTLSNPVAAVLGSTASASGMIMDDDDANPKGYFTGVANVNSTSYSDMTGIAYNNRLMVFSPAANVLYDIAITSISVTDFSGTVNVYVSGNNTLEAVTVTGTTNESRIQATFAGGTGLAVGSFDILFDTQNNRGATLARVSTVTSPVWEGNFFGIDVDTGSFASNVLGQYSSADDTVERCGASGTFVLPDSSLNIYQLSHDVVDSTIGTCFTTYESSGHTGFASVIDNVTTDDGLIYAFTNSTFALFAVVSH